MKIISMNWCINIKAGHMEEDTKSPSREISKLKLLKVILSKFSLKIILRSFWKISHNTLFYALAILCCSFEVIMFYLKRRFGKHRVPNYQIVDGLQLYRGGQPSNAGLKHLAENGIKTIINLRTGDFDRKAIKAYYQDKVRCIHLPFYPYSPTDTIMLEFLRIMISPSNTPVYVHCFHGADRTGTVCALYRIVVQNWDKEDAILEMEKHGLHWWQRHLVDYIRNVDAESIRKKLHQELSLATPK